MVLLKKKEVYVVLSLDLQVKVEDSRETENFNMQVQA